MTLHLAPLTLPFSSVKDTPAMSLKLGAMRFQLWESLLA